MASGTDCGDIHISLPAVCQLQDPRPKRSGKCPFVSFSTWRHLVACGISVRSSPVMPPSRCCVSLTEYGRQKAVSSAVPSAVLLPPLSGHVAASLDLNQRRFHPAFCETELGKPFRDRFGPLASFKAEMTTDQLAKPQPQSRWKPSQEFRILSIQSISRTALSGVSTHPMY